MPQVHTYEDLHRNEEEGVTRSSDSVMALQGDWTSGPVWHLPGILLRDVVGHGMQLPWSVYSVLGSSSSFVR